MTVSFKSRITGVRRTSQGVRIYVNNQPREYSFLIWTPEVKTALELFKDLKKDEKKAFDDSQTDYLISSLVWLEAGKLYKGIMNLLLANLLNLNVKYLIENHSSKAHHSRAKM